MHGIFSSVALVPKRYDRARGGLIYLSAILSVTMPVAISATTGPKPFAVSPGGRDGATILEPCPTFSWSAVEGATSYELLLYTVDESTSDAGELLRREIPGAALSWTPSIEHCLERGREFAWMVRALTGKGATSWSEIALFEISIGPSEREFEAALWMVREYLGVNSAENTSGNPSRSYRPSGEGTATPVMSEPGGLPRSVPLPPPAPTDFSIDSNGKVSAPNFVGGHYFGNGAGLSNVHAVDVSCTDCISPNEIDSNFLDADFLDGFDSSDFALADHVHLSSMQGGSESATRQPSAAQGWVSLGSAAFSRSEGSRFEQLYVPVQLPDGVVVRELRVRLDSRQVDERENADVELVRVHLESEHEQPMAGIATEFLGVPGAATLAITSIEYATVDNSTYAYLLKVADTGVGQGSGVRSVRIRYEAVSPLQ